MCMSTDTTLKVKSSGFYNVETTNAEGGAIYASSQGADINNCTFVNCHETSTVSYGSGGHGGAVYFHAEFAEGEEVIESCVFDNCSSTESGGGLFALCRDNERALILESDYGKYSFRLNRCNFTRCKSGVEGGAVSSGLNIYGIKSGDNDFGFTNCWFIECESKQGGALYFQDGTKEGDEETKISSCHFINCYATGGQGYALLCRSYLIYIDFCEFRDHRRELSVPSHSVVYVETNEEEVTPSLTLCTFENNTGVSSLTLNVSNSVTIDRFTFKNSNLKDLMDGVIVNLDLWSIKGTLALQECHFTNISNCQCISSIMNNFTTNVNKCEFSNISAKLPSGFILQYGGCISSLSSHSNLIANESIFSDISVFGGHGGAIYALSESIDIKGCKFIRCHVSSSNSDSSEEVSAQGGAIYLDASSGHDEEVISNCTFVNCSSIYSGGAIFVYCYDQNISQNIERHDIMIVDCNFTNCTSKVEGGAISSGLKLGNRPIEGDDDFSVNNCRFEQCESSRGGALYFQDGTKDGDEETNIQNCTFYNCYSTGSKHEGYAIYCRSYRMIIYNCEFFYHSPRLTNETGSIVYVETNEADVSPQLNGLMFNDNSNIPSIVIRSMDPVSLYNSVFSSSPLHINDEWEVSEIKFIGCQFQHNSGEKGGSVYISSTPSTRKARKVKILSNTSFIFEGCQFINSTAKQGGAIYAESITKLVLNSCSFYNSTASENGGAIYTSAQSSISRCNFSQTKSPKGAAIFAVLENDINITDITLDITKEEGVSAILVSGGNSSNHLTFSGSGCFISSGKNETDRSADFIGFDSEGSLNLAGNMCFSGSVEDSIKLPPGTSVDKGWFNCNSCPAPPPPNVWDPSQGAPSIAPTPNMTDFPEITPNENTKSKSKLSTGAIAGIVVGCVVFAGLIVAIVLLFVLRRNRLSMPRPQDIASQEVDTNFGNQDDTTTNNPFWAAQVESTPINGPVFDNENGESEDPFIKEFDEGY